MNLWLVWLQSGNIFFKHWHSLLLSSQKTEARLLIPSTDNFSFCHPWMLLGVQCCQWLLETSLNSFIPALLGGISLPEVLHEARKKPASPLVPPCRAKKLTQGMDFPSARSCCAAQQQEQHPALLAWNSQEGLGSEILDTKDVLPITSADWGSDPPPSAAGRDGVLLARRFAQHLQPCNQSCVFRFSFSLSSRFPGKP